MEKQKSNIITAGLSVVIVALQCCQIVNVILMGLLFLLGGVLLFFLLWEIEGFYSFNQTAKPVFSIKIFSVDKKNQPHILLD